MKLISDAMAQTEPAPAAPTPAPAANPAGASAVKPTGTQTSVAQAAPDASSAPAIQDLAAQLIPIVVIMAIVYIVVIRPRQRREKEQESLLKNVRRGDVMVTTSGIVGKVTKATDDTEIELEIAPNVRVRLLRSAIAEVRARSEPVKDQGASAKS
jgi:preprotein translocase subunit YajC